MSNDEDIMGQYGEDRITGFRGRITGIVRYISGCTQVLLTPKVGTDGKMPEGQFIDIQRIKVDETVVRIMLDNAPTPGFDQLPKAR
jgi:hypothetical protein